MKAPTFAPPVRPVPIILDTDMGTDCDDAAALAMLHACMDTGDANLLAVVVNNRADASVGAVAAINTYYGRPEIPLGAYTGETVGEPHVPIYTEIVDDVARYGHLVTTRRDAPAAVDVYRRALSDAPDAGVVVVSIGFLNNLDDLLASGADEISPLDGRELVRLKVAHLVMMGGDYPSGAEYNFCGENAGPCTAPVLENWPTPILFSGYSLGERIITGPVLKQLPEDNPVRLAYVRREDVPIDNGRPSWDQTAILAAVYGPDRWWNLSPAGRNRVDPDGSNTWQDDPGGSCAYLIEREPVETVVADIERLMIAARAGVPS